MRESLGGPQTRGASQADIGYDKARRAICMQTFGFKLLLIDFITASSTMIKELIIGLGGAGNNVLNDLFDNGYVNLLFISPDKENIKTSSVLNKVHYKIEESKDIIKSFENNKEEIDLFLKDSNKVHLIAGLGGTFASTLFPVISDFLKSKFVTVNGIVFMPFDMEGPEKIKKSNNAITTIEEKVDSINIINLQEQFSEPELGQGGNIVLELFDIVNKKVKGFIN